MLFNSLSEPESAVERTQLVVADRVPIELVHFRAAWQTLTRQYDILRTRFVWQHATKPYQVVEPLIEPVIEVLDWQNTSRDGLENRINRLVADDRRKPLDLSKAPMWRITIADRGDAGYHALWTFHHSMLDGRSYTRLVAEFYRNYDALCAGHDALPPRLQHDFREFVDWLNSRDTKRTQNFWRERLSGFKSPTPIGVPWTPETSAERRSCLTRRVSASTTAALQAFAERAGASMSTVCTAAWSLLLFHHSGEAGVLFGSTFSGRRAKIDGIQDMIGLLITTLPVRVVIDPDMPLTEWLSTLRDQLRSVGEHEQISVPELLAVSELEPGQLLYESVLVFNNASLDGQVAALYDGWSGRSLSRHQDASLPLRLDIFGGNSLALELRYFRDRFDDRAAERMLQSYETILASFGHDSPVRIGDVAHLPPEDRNRLLVEWNDTATDFRQSANLHDLFGRVAENKRQAEAVVCGDQRLSYAELEARANQLARHLIRVGAKPGEPIGLCVNRSPDLIVALLAILKTGGAYVPMDPVYPSERLAYMLDTAGCELMVSETDLADFATGRPVRIVSLDADREEIALEDKTSPKVSVDPESLAYVIFTSGSTGNPKGVQIPHRAVVNFLLSMHERPGLNDQTRLLAVTTASFDIHVLEIFGPLTIGGTVILATREDMLVGNRLRDAITTHRVNCMQATPTTWRLLLASGWTGSPDFVALVGGEPLPRDLLRELMDVLPGVWNMYGPTETTVWSTCCQLTDGDAPILIGRPIANTQVYVLDAELEPVPIGSPGELYIGGDGVSHGYINQPELTVERFPPNPFAFNGRAFYRTGDMVRFHRDGSLEFMQRIDNQVKLRGFRIELGEIEMTLASHPDVAQAAARIWGGGSDASLVVYLVARAAKSLSSEALLTHLRRRLPEYMMPARFIALDALPLTANGKIDRRALPEPGITGLAQDDELIEPRTELERMVLEIWEKILNLSRLGINSNFFESGGNSLLALRAVDEMSRVLGRNVGVETLFECPTVERIVDAVGEKVDHDHSLVHLGNGIAEREEAPLYCVSGIYVYEPLARSLLGVIDVYGVYVRGEVDAIDNAAKSRGPNQVTTQIAADYVTAIRNHRSHGPYRLAGISYGGAIAFEAARQLTELGEDVDCVIMFDSAIPSRRQANIVGRLILQLNEMRLRGPRYFARSARYLKRYAHLVHRRMRQLLNPDSRTSVAELDQDRRFNRLAHLKRYRPETIDARLLIFRAGGGTTLRGFNVSSELGWEGMAKRGIKVFGTSGGHLEMLDTQHVEEITQVLERELTK